jgi:hypothetical protein
LVPAQRVTVGNLDEDDAHTVRVLDPHPDQSPWFLPRRQAVSGMIGCDHGDYTQGRDGAMMIGIEGDTAHRFDDPATVLASVDVRGWRPVASGAGEGLLRAWSPGRQRSGSG